MFQEMKVRFINTLHHPKARVILILGTLVVAALASGAPGDSGGF